MNELISKWIKQIQRTQKSDQAPGNLHLNCQKLLNDGNKKEPFSEPEEKKNL